MSFKLSSKTLAEITKGITYMNWWRLHNYFLIPFKLYNILNGGDNIQLLMKQYHGKKGVSRSVKVKGKKRKCTRKFETLLALRQWSIHKSNKGEEY